MKKKPLSLALALAMCLGLMAPAFADAGTTTVDDAAKDRSPNTEIYAVTQAPGSDYPYYGARNEPSAGVYYGRTCEGGTFPDGHFGLINEDQMAGESAVGFYYDLDPNYSLEYWNYMYGPAVNDGSRAFMVYINFSRGADDCAAYVSGQYDGMLTEAFTYLGTLKNPVFIRIGGEMNEWALGSEQAYINAFRHVADLAHRTASNIATVFSPNFTSGYLVDMDTFYPGDDYVDWVGVSLYYDAVHNFLATPGDKEARFQGVGQYGDALLNVQQGVNLSRLHKKPLMATEGGSANSHNDQDLSAQAAARVEKAFAFLPMVYPEIKCIISSDYHHGFEANSYKFYNNPTVTAAYRKGVASNSAYLDKVGGSASYYTRLSAYAGKWEGTMNFAAYTYTPVTDAKPTAAWSVDGQVQATVSEYPYSFSLNVDALSTGSHTVAVTFSNGAAKSYSFQKEETPIYASNNAQVSKWAKDQVNEAISKKLLADGLGADYRVSITRAQFAATAVKLYEAMSGQAAPAVSKNPFSDTTDIAVRQAAELGFVNGKGDGLFAPDELVTREQAAVMLSRVYTKLGGDIPATTATSFDDDGAIGGWARDSVAFMASRKIINGVGDNTFDPKGEASIEQALAISLRMFKSLK